MSSAVARQSSPSMGGSVYQIDFTAVAAGKRFSTTKRRVRWRFGFVNKDALESGQTGTSCRGEEHDITIVWSLTSGKRLILADGQEIHYSNNRTAVFEFSWTMRGNHVLKVVAHAAPAMSATPGFRQYDLFVDGQSFFVMPKVYELGIRPGKGPPESKNMYSNYSAPKGVPAEAPPYGPNSETQEDYDLQRAIRESLKDSASHLSKKDPGAPKLAPMVERAPPIPAAAVPMVRRESEIQDLLDFASEPAPAPTAPQGQVNYGQDPSGYGQPPAQPAPYDPFAIQQTPSYNSVTSDVLAAYNQPNGAAPAPSYNNYAQPSQPPAQPSHPQQQPTYNSAPNPNFSSPQPNGYPEQNQEYSSPYSAVTDPTNDGTGTNGSPRNSLQVDTNFEQDGQQQGGGAQQAGGWDNTFKNIVNLDDINSPAESPESTNPFENTFKDNKPAKKGQGMVQPTYGWGPKPTLAEMKSMQGKQQQPQQNAGGVMRAPPNGISTPVSHHGSVPPTGTTPPPPGAPGAMVMFGGGMTNPAGVNNWSVPNGGVAPMGGQPMQQMGAPPQAPGYPAPAYGAAAAPTNGYPQQQQQQQQQQWAGQQQYPPQGQQQYPPQGQQPAQQGYYQQQQQYAASQY